MTIPAHPSLRSVLPWFAAIAVGTSIHLAYWMTNPRTEVRVVTAPAAPTSCDCACGPAPTKTAAATTAVEDEHLAPRVLEDERYELDFEAVRESFMKNPALLAKTARLVPSFDEGEQVGLKVYGVRRGSLFKLLDFKNGDLLQAVNGVKLDTSSMFLALEHPLDEIEIQIERRGKTFTKTLVNRPRSATP